MKTKVAIRLKKCSIIHWHNLKENPENLPKPSYPCWYLVAVVLWNKEKTGLSWGTYPGYWNPEKKEWQRYNIPAKSYEKIAGEVVMWADFPLSFLEIMNNNSHKED